MSKIKICIDQNTLDSNLGQKYKNVIEFLKKNYSFNIISGNEFNDEAYLKQKYKDYDFVLIFNQNKSYKQIDNLIYYPMDIYSMHSEYLDNQNFSYFATLKPMYHELSNIYMDLIANDTKKEIDFLYQIYIKYNNHQSKKVVDFCCGVGRHVYGLSKKGFKVVGVDISKDQIQIAKQKHFNEFTRYYIGDSKNIKLKETFDMAVCMWTTYNYFKEEELKDFFDNIYIHLNENGILILDAKNSIPLEPFRIYHRNKQNEQIDLEQLVIKRIINQKIQNSQYFLFIKENDKCRFIMDEEFVHFYTLEEITKMISKKFDIISVFGNFDGEKYQPQTSERMIIVLKKI